MAERTYGPTVWKISVLPQHEMPEIGSEYVNATVVELLEEHKVKVCYSKEYDPCLNCIRVECPFSPEDNEVTA